MRAPKRIKQQDHSDCGAACLASISAYFGYNLPLAEIRMLASTGRNGTSVRGMLEAAEAMGFIAKGIKGEPSQLPSVPAPSILLLKLEGNRMHFVVLSRIRGNRVRFMDPASGSMRNLDREKFNSLWTGVVCLMAPGPVFRKKNMERSISSRILEILVPYRSSVMQALFGALICSILALSNAVFVQKIIDNVLVSSNHNLLNLLTVAMLFLLFSRIGISWVKNLLLFRAGQCIDAGLLLGYYRHLLSLPQKFFDGMKTGEILSRMGDAIKIRNFLNQSLLELTVSVLTILFTLTAMAFVSGRLSLVAASGLLMIIVIYALADRLNRRYFRGQMEKAAVLESFLVESVSGQSSIRALGCQGWAVDETGTRLADYLRINHSAGITGITSMQLADLISGFLSILVLWLGTRQVLNKNLSPGELMSFFTLLGYLFTPARQLGNISRILREAVIAAERLFQVTNLEPEKNARQGLKPGRIIHDIEFRKVDFHYGGGPLVLRDLNFTIPYGKITGLTGESGSGKSSIAAMLHSVYPPTSGSILLNGCDIRGINLNYLRSHIGLVSQTTGLFSGSILRNVCPLDTKPDYDRLIHISGKTGLLDMVNKLPSGFETEIGEQGVCLSGGERQRVAITRCIYQDPDLLILDEAVSGLDSASQNLILELIKHLSRQGKTILLISHDKGVLGCVDKLIILKSATASELSAY